MPEISNLVFHVKCNDNAANTVITDSSATANNGTLGGGDNTSAKSEAGKINSCFHLNGSDDYGTFTDNPAYNWTNAVSASAWVYVDVMAVGTTYVGKYFSATNNREWVFWTAQPIAGNFRLAVDFGDKNDGTYEGRWQTVSNINAIAGGWHWIAFTYNAGTVKFYIDNVEWASQSGGGAVPSTLYNGVAPVTIGELNATYYLDGKIDDVRIYTKVLSEDERDFIYNNGNGTESNNTDAGSAIIWEPEFMVMNGGFDI